ERGGGVCGGGVGWRRGPGGGGRAEVMSVTIVAARFLRGVDTDLREVGLVDLDLGLGAQAVDEVLLGRQALLAEQLVADLRLRVIEALRDRLAPAGLLEHVER